MHRSVPIRLKCLEARRLTLRDSRSNKTIQRATLELDPHWLSGDGSRDDEIEAAFRAYAESLLTTR